MKTITFSYIHADDLQSTANGKELHETLYRLSLVNSFIEVDDGLAYSFLVTLYSLQNFIEDATTDFNSDGVKHNCFDAINNIIREIQEQGYDALFVCEEERKNQTEEERIEQEKKDLEEMLLKQAKKNIRMAEEAEKEN